MISFKNPDASGIANVLGSANSYTLTVGTVGAVNVGRLCAPEPAPDWAVAAAPVQALSKARTAGSHCSRMYCSQPQSANAAVTCPVVNPSAVA